MKRQIAESLIPMYFKSFKLISSGDLWKGGCIYDAGLKLMKSKVISKTALYSWSDLYNLAILRPEPFQTPDNGASCYSRPLA